MSKEKELEQTVPEQATESTGLTPLQDDSGNQLMADLSSRQTSFCSFEPKTREEKALLYNLTNSTAERLADHIGETITVKDIYAEIIQLTDKETGETFPAARVILIDGENKGYVSVSVGIMSSVKRLFAAFGFPTWKEPIPVKIVQLNRGDNKRLFTLQVAL